MKLRFDNKSFANSQKIIIESGITQSNWFIYYQIIIRFIYLFFVNYNLIVLLLLSGFSINV